MPMSIDQFFGVHDGDCLELMACLPSQSVAMVLTDLPYGTTQNAWDSVVPFEPLWAQIRRVLVPTGVAVFTASQPFTSRLVMSNLSWFRHEWIWIKNRGSNFLNAKREPMKEHESVLVFSPGRWTYHRQMQSRSGGGQKLVGSVVSHGGKSENYGKYRPRREVLPELRVPSSWQKFNTAANGLHPTVKPVPLFEYLIRTYTNENDVVLDPCCGSDTTGVACRQLKRQAIQFDLSRDYCAIAEQRLRDDCVIC